MINFILYFAVSVALLLVFSRIYVWFTPYNEYDEIMEGNSAAAISLGGALIGFTLPVASSIYYTQSLMEMIMWASITCISQLVSFSLLKKYALHIGSGNKAAAIFLAATSISIGLLNSVSISH